VMMMAITQANTGRSMKNCGIRVPRDLGRFVWSASARLGRGLLLL
jgi:hypothetical protein